MARPKSEDYEDIKDYILDRSAELFARAGFGSTSLLEIAAACGCSKSRLYHYFDTKEQLLFEMLRTHIDHLTDECQKAITAAGTPKAKFSSLIRTVVRIYANSKSKHITLLQNLDALPGDLRADIVKRERELVVIVTMVLRDLRPDVSLPRDYFTVRAMSLFGMVNWTCFWYDPTGSVQPDELAENFIDLFLNGFLPTKKS